MLNKLWVDQGEKFYNSSMQKWLDDNDIQVGLSPSKKSCVICLITNPLKMMKIAIYFILKALFVLKIFKFLSQLFGHVGKTAKIHDPTTWFTNKQLQYTYCPISHKVKATRQYSNKKYFSSKIMWKMRRGD